jgi:hypothetical protein
MKEKLRTLGIDAVGSTPKEYAELIVNDKARFEQAVKIAGAKAE